MLSYGTDRLAPTSLLIHLAPGSLFVINLKHDSDLT